MEQIPGLYGDGYAWSLRSIAILDLL